MNCDNQNCKFNNPKFCNDEKIQLKRCLKCSGFYFCSQECKSIHVQEFHKNSPPVQSMQSSFYSTTSSQWKKSNKKKRIEDFEIIEEQIGQGAFGVVNKAIDTIENHVVALKKINKEMLRMNGEVDSLKAEVKIQKQLQFPHIILLYNYFEDKSNVYLSLEYAEKGSLFQYIRKNGKLVEKQAFIFFLQTCSALNFLHDQSVIHRDIKPENILLDENYNIKICDFGYSQRLSQARTSFCGTTEYLSPEVIQGSVQTEKVDIWCLGILLYEMLHGYTPVKFESIARNDMLEKLKNFSNGSIKFHKSLSQEAKDLILSLVKFKPSERPDIERIINHSWIKNFSNDLNINAYDYVFVSQQPQNLYQIISCQTPGQPKSRMRLDSLTTIFQSQKVSNNQNQFKNSNNSKNIIGNQYYGSNTTTHKNSSVSEKINFKESLQNHQQQEQKFQQYSSQQSIKLNQPKQTQINSLSTQDELMGPCDEDNIDMDEGTGSSVKIAKYNNFSVKSPKFTNNLAKNMNQKSKKSKKNGVQSSRESSMDQKHNLKKSRKSNNNEYEFNNEFYNKSTINTEVQPFSQDILSPGSNSDQDDMKNLIFQNKSATFYNPNNNNNTNNNNNNITFSQAQFNLKQSKSQAQQYSTQQSYSTQQNISQQYTTQRDYIQQQYQLFPQTQPQQMKNNKSSNKKVYETRSGESTRKNNQQYSNTKSRDSIFSYDSNLSGSQDNFRPKKGQIFHTSQRDSSNPGKFMARQSAQEYNFSSYYDNLDSINQTPTQKQFQSKNLVKENTIKYFTPSNKYKRSQE